MLLSCIKNYQNILKFFPQLDIVFDFIINNVSDKTLEGKYDISRGIYAVIQKCEPKIKKEQLLETHKKYVDLQYVISGKEKIGWKFLDKSFKICKKYNPKQDIAFFSNRPDTYIRLKKGEFAIFFPEDAHAPLCCDNTVKKCIVKIPKIYFNN